MVAAIHELRPLTIEDLAEFPEDNVRREIITGELIVSPSPTLRHQLISSNLLHLLRSWVDQNPVGICVSAPMDVRLTVNDIVQPDLLYVAAGRKDIKLGKFIDG